MSDRYYAQLDSLITNQLRWAIQTMREACDDAERRMAWDTGRSRICTVLARLRSGFNSSQLHIESAIAALGDQAECFKAEATPAVDATDAAT